MLKPTELCISRKKIVLLTAKKTSFYNPHPPMVYQWVIYDTKIKGNVKGITINDHDYVMLCRFSCVHNMINDHVKIKFAN